MAGFDPTEYGITIRKKSIDGQMHFVGTVNELPDIEVFEETYQDAYVELINVVTDLKAIADKRDRKFPPPASAVNYEFSGRVTLRIPKSIHWKATTIAESEGVSLNHFIASIIAEAVGIKSVVAPRPTSEIWRIDVRKAYASASAAVIHFNNAFTVGTAPSDAVLGSNLWREGKLTGGAHIKRYEDNFLHSGAFPTRNDKLWIAQ
jgi:predicted HicB family RNase H-like nuclease